MSTCQRCGAGFTGGRYQDLCPVCTDRLARKFYADPTEASEWVRRQNQRVDGMRGILATMKMLRLTTSNGLHRGVEGVNGLCPKCERPLDEHRLTYSTNAYPEAQCHGPAPSLPPTPSQDSEGMSWA